MNVELVSKNYLDELYIKLFSEENQEVFGLHENKLKENGNLLENHKSALEKNEERINLTSTDFNKWKKEVDHELEVVTTGMYELDGRFTKSVE
jgi:hypothetical protein